MKNAIIFILLLFGSSLLYSQKNNPEKLRALLIVGKQEDGTKKAIDRMDILAQLFEKNGVQVFKFYDDKAVWEDIIKVSKDCSFLVYAGHGSIMGKDGNAGGIYITRMISTKELLSTLKLKENALVLFKSVCRGAGSSAGDNGDIGIEEAKKRVTHYAYPFFEIGAAAYYASNYVTGIDDFLEDFFAGKTLKQAFINSANWVDIEFETSFSGYSEKMFSIASSKGEGTITKTRYLNGEKIISHVKAYKKYNIAFVGPADFTINKMQKNNKNGYVHTSINR